VLADVLRAYGRTRDVDAVRVLLSFCNSDRIQLREAARESIAAIGEPGHWQLKDVYLGLTGEKPPRDWAWDRIARELFGLYDRARLAEVYRLMDDGLAAAAASKHEEATAAFDKVLARAPLFDRRKEMVPTYVARAKELEAKGSLTESLELYRKAYRLDPKSPDVKKLEAEIAYVEGMVLIAQGTPDRFILNRALELDPGHTRAREALASFEEKAVARQSSMKRYAIAGGIGVAALIAMLLLIRRRKDPPPGGPQREIEQEGEKAGSSE
jgi:tetratricopeptide (TPR) repeat protein